MLKRIILALIFASVALPAYADFDGRWQGTYSCSKLTSGRLGPFTWSLQVDIGNGVVSSRYNYQIPDRGNVPATASFYGRVDPGGNARVDIMTIDAKGVPNFHSSLVGKTIGADQIELSGPMLTGDQRPVRECSLTLTLITRNSQEAVAPPRPYQQPTAKPQPAAPTQQAAPTPSTVPAITGQQAAATPPVPVAPQAVGRKDVTPELANLPAEEQTAWQPFVGQIPIQETEFCHVVENFEHDSAKLEQARNDIKMNELAKQFRRDLDSLFHGGDINSWLGYVIEVKQVEEGSVAVILKAPCDVFIGSYLGPNCQKPGNFEGIIKEDSPLYRELSKFEYRDIVLFGGNLPATQDPSGLKSVTQYKYFLPDQRCIHTDNGDTGMLFVSDLKSIFKTVPSPNN